MSLKINLAGLVAYLKNEIGWIRMVNTEFSTLDMYYETFVLVTWLAEPQRKI